MKLVFNRLFLFLILFASSLLAVEASDDMSIRSSLDYLMNKHPEFNKDVLYDVNQGVVVLQGEVTNFADKAFAERMATNIPGVYRVRNLLVIDFNRKNI